jgi:hypothetical protein
MTAVPERTAVKDSRIPSEADLHVQEKRDDLNTTILLPPSNSD